MYRLVPTDSLARRGRVDHLDTHGIDTQPYLYTWPVEPWAIAHFSGLYDTVEAAEVAARQLALLAEMHEDTPYEGRSDWWGIAIVHAENMITIGNHWCRDGVQLMPAPAGLLRHPDYRFPGNRPPYFGSSVTSDPE